MRKVGMANLDGSLLLASFSDPSCRFCSWHLQSGSLPSEVKFQLLSGRWKAADGGGCWPAARGIVQNTMGETRLRSRATTLHPAIALVFE